MPGYDTLVSALETRYDFHSARIMANEAVKSAGLEDRKDWSADDLKTIVGHVASDGKDMSVVMERLGLVEPAPAAEPAADAQQSWA